MKKKLLAALTACLLIFSVLPASVKGAGGFYISTSYLSLEPGGSATVYIGADNAAGAYSVSAGGAVSAAMNGDGWLDNSSQSVTVYADSTGTGYVTFTVYDGATYDDEDLSGWSATVTVEVTEPAQGYDGGNDTPYIDVTTTAPDNNPYEEPNHNTEEDESSTETTTEDMTVVVTIEGMDYTVLPDLSGLEVLEGFTPEETDVEGKPVDSFVCDDIRVCMLENMDTMEWEYFLYDEAKGKFTKMNYETIGDSLYIFLPLPDGFEIPRGYKETELSIGNGKAQALQLDEAVLKEAGTANDKFLAPEAAAQSYYLYCLNRGAKAFYSYDSEAMTMQPVAAFVPVGEAETTEETTTVPEPETEPEPKGWTGALPSLRTMAVALGIAILALIGMLVIYIVSNSKKRTQDTAAAPKPVTDEAPAEETVTAPEVPEEAAEETPAEEASAEVPAETPAEPAEVPAEVPAEPAEIPAEAVGMAGAATSAAESSREIPEPGSFRNQRSGSFRRSNYYRAYNQNRRTARARRGRR